MRRTVVAVALTALALTGCDDEPEELADTPSVSPVTTPSEPPPATASSEPGGLPTDPGTGSAAPAPDQPGPEAVPTPAERPPGS